MGRFTASENPDVEESVESHLSRIVEGICERVDPLSVILRGSFGRGEGSVLAEDSGLTFLSDYEISVVSGSALHRRILRELSEEATLCLGVKTEITWMRRGRILNNRSNNLAYTSDLPNIATYELRHGSQTLYGRDLLAQAPTIEPKNIPLESGIRLLVNRMAEALDDAPGASVDILDRLEAVRRLSKVILACGESILLAWEAYHYSYAERNRRFADLAPGRLSRAIPGAAELPSLMERATLMKLQPSSTVYGEDGARLLAKVIAVADATFRYLVEVDLGVLFGSYVDLPTLFLNHPKVRRGYSHYRLPPLPIPLDQMLVNAVKYLRQGQCPPWGFFTHPNITINRVVFAIVPMLFVNRPGGSESIDGVLRKIRDWLSLVVRLDDRSAEEDNEWESLRSAALWAWRRFCYD